MQTTESRRKPKKASAAYPLPPHIGSSCPTCGDDKPFKAVHGVEVCCGCHRPLPTAQRFNWWSTGWASRDKLVTA